MTSRGWSVSSAAQSRKLDRGRTERELHEELQSHIALETAARCAQGVPLAPLLGAQDIHRVGVRHPKRWSGGRTERDEDEYTGHEADGKRIVTCEPIDLARND